MNADDVRAVREMIAIIERSRMIVARGEATFFASTNPVEFWAARMVVIDLDIAADRVSDEFKTAHNEIPWQALARTRDKYAHHYDDIDRGVVWNLIQTRLPRMAADLGAAISADL